MTITLGEAMKAAVDAQAEIRRLEAEAKDLLLMNDDATVTPLTRCDHCKYLFVDIEKHVAESVSVYGGGTATVRKGCDG